ncbi:MAG: 6,7-dimethyl-8-ribityllumazine synthase [Candidatus Bipolaricaulota bacterium]
MSEEVEGYLDGSGLEIGIVVSRFNDLVTGNLLEGARDRLQRLGVAPEQITTVWVPGAFELPRGVKSFASSRNCDGIVALGAVIRGETPHFQYVASEVSKGLAKANLELSAPVSFGLITSDTMDQAIDRSGGKQGNKGAEAAESLVEMINLECELSE